MVIIETERLFLREMTKNDFEALYKVLADSDIMQHYPYTFDDTRVKRWINKNIERYQIFGFGLWAVRDWTFNNTPFNTIYSYMKHTNIPSSQTAISYGCKQIEEFADEVNDVTKVFAITREEWIITLFKRAPELTEDQEKKLHQLGRKVRKKFGMKPIRM